MDIRDYNRQAWDRKVAEKSIWTVPVDTKTIEAAREGEWRIILTPTKSVPRGWFGDLNNCDLLCLASGGGQQGPTPPARLVFSLSGGRMAHCTLFGRKNSSRRA